MVGLTVGPAVIVVRMMVVLVTVTSRRLRLRLLSGRVLREEGAGPGPAGGQEAEEHLDRGILNDTSTPFIFYSFILKDIYILSFL